MGDDIWTVRRILGWIEGYLAKRGDGNPRLSAQWLVSEALGLSRMQLYLDLERPLSQAERDVLRDYTRRRGAGEPLQYITGEAAFRHITLKVREGALIPRPETEVLVSEALALLPAAGKPQDALDAELLRRYVALGGELPEGEEGGGANALSGELAGIRPRDSEAPLEVLGRFSREDAETLLVADLCTGSGCIACSIAFEHPATRVIATDLSPDAVALARENVDALGLAGRVDVVECDLGRGIDPGLAGRFDLVVSNPPYIPSAVLAGLPREVSGYEPQLALDGGADGLDVFRRLLAWSWEALKPGGGLAVELHEACLDAACALAEAAGFAEVRQMTDLAAKPRVLVARRPGAEARGMARPAGQKA